MINLSTGANKAITRQNPSTKTYVVGTDISFGDGDGTGGTDTINASTTDLSVFTEGCFVLLHSGVAEANTNAYVKVVSSSTTKLEVPAGSLTVLAAGPQIKVEWFDLIGSLSKTFQNGIMEFYAENKSGSADNAEPGSPIFKATLNALAFTAGVPTNGINMDSYDGLNLTFTTGDVIQGTPSSTSTIQSARFYANAYERGASTSAVRLDGSVGGPTSNADFIIESGATVTQGVTVTVTFKLQAYEGNFIE